jgi:hypothetical protein
VSGGGAPGPDERSPLERAFDLFVYAPLGMVFTAKEELPRLIAKGRQGSAGQVGMARVVGQFAVGQGQREAAKLARRLAGRLADLGVVPDPSRRPGPTTKPGQGGAGEPSGARTRPAGSPGTGSPSTAAGAPAAGTGPDRPDVAALSIPDYDSLSAPQVVQRLDGLSASELEAVRSYEAATRGRKTILSRVAQLQSGQ